MGISFNIDTVTFGFQIAPSSSQLSGWKHHRLDQNSDGREWERYTTTIHMPGGWSLNAEFYPQTISASEKIPFMKLECSLAKVLFGNNVEMAGNYFDAVDKANKELRLLLQIPPVDLYEAGLYRIDPCYNHQVGDHVPDYLRVFSGLNFPHRKVIIYPDQTVLFRAKSVSSKFYDKFAECKLPQASGILRQEITLRDRGRIETLFGLQRVTISSITNEKIREILIDDLQKLKLFEQVITNPDIATDKLINAYGSKIGYRLIGYLIRRQKLSKEQIMENDRLGESTLYKNEELIASAGISMVLINNKESLPPLQINIFDKNIPQSPSVT